jgi:hypothetical protein
MNRRYLKRLKNTKKTAVMEELLYWKTNMTQLFLQGRMTGPVPQELTARLLASFVQRKRDYFAVMERIKELENRIR